MYPGYYPETSRSFEEAVHPEKDSVSAAAKILQDCSLSSPRLLESAVYRAFTLLCESEGGCIFTYSLFLPLRLFSFEQKFTSMHSCFLFCRELKGVGIRCPWIPVQ